MHVWQNGDGRRTFGAQKKAVEIISHLKGGHEPLSEMIWLKNGLK